MLYKCNRVFVTVSHDFYQCLMKMWMKTNHVLYEVDLGPGHMGLRMGHFKRLSDFKSDAQIVTSGYGQFWWFAEKSKEIVMKLGRQPTTAHWSGWAFEAFNAFTKSRVGYTRFGTWHLHVLSYIAQFEPGGSISYIGVGSCTIRLWQRWGEMQECGVSNWRVIIEGHRVRVSACMRVHAHLSYGAWSFIKLWERRGGMQECDVSRRRVIVDCWPWENLMFSLPQH